MPETSVPRFWSAEFHLRFFPGLLLAQIKNHPDGRKRHIFFEIPVAFVFCAILIAIGMPSALERHSIFGWLMTALGAGGTSALFVYCLRATAGTPLSYLEFEPWIFLFLTAVGVFGGWLASDALGSIWYAKGVVFLGLGLGYLSGIGAGLGIQRLGPLRAFVAMAAGFGLFIVVGTFIIYASYIKK